MPRRGETAVVPIDADGGRPKAPPGRSGSHGPGHRAPRRRRRHAAAGRDETAVVPIDADGGRPKAPPGRSGSHGPGHRAPRRRRRHAAAGRDETAVVPIDADGGRPKAPPGRSGSHGHRQHRSAPPPPATAGVPALPALVPIPRAALHRRQHRPLRPHHVRQRMPRPRRGCHRRGFRRGFRRGCRRAGLHARAGARQVCVPAVQGEPPRRANIRDIAAIEEQG